MINNQPMPEYLFLILPIILINILANIFTPNYKSTIKTYAKINALSLTTITLLLNKNIIIFCALLSFSLLLIYFTIDKKVKKIMLFNFFTTSFFIAILSTFTTDHSIIFYIFLLAFLGLFPLQNWYLKFFESAHFSVIAAFVCLQGIVILMGEIIFTAPQNQALIWIITLSSLSCSFLSLIQPNTRRALAYLVASQLGFLSFSHLTNSTIMNIGTAFMTFSLIGATCAFILMIGALEIRRENLSLIEPSGNYDSYPKLAFLILIFGLTSSGLPLSIGYIAEDLIFEGSFIKSPTIDILWLIAIAINTIIIVKFFLFLCQGKPHKQKGLDITITQLIAASIMIATMFISAILI